MAAIDHSAYAPAAVSPFAGFADTLRGVQRSVRTYIAYRQTRNTLSQLSMRQLEDIGLDGANIDSLALEMAKRNTL